jgi:DNA-binding transcriptional MerR regulator
MTPADTTTVPVLRIGDVAAQTGVSVEALRYYERRGLLRPLQRGPSGNRVFPPDVVRVVRFIKHAQAFGFSLTEIQELVRLRERARTGNGTRELRDIAVARVRDINRRVRELRALSRELTELIAACDDAGCGVPDETTGNVSREVSEGRVTGALPCPLVEAFDASVVPPESKSHNGERPRVRSRRKNSVDDPPRPGRRPGNK